MSTFNIKPDAMVNYIVTYKSQWRCTKTFYTDRREIEADYPKMKLPRLTTGKAVKLNTTYGYYIVIKVSKPAPYREIRNKFRLNHRKRMEAGIRAGTIMMVDLAHL